MSDDSDGPRGAGAGSPEAIEEGDGGDALDGGVADTAASSEPEEADAPSGDEEADEEIAPGLSDDGIVLAFAGGACLLAATTAYVTGQRQPIVVFGLVAGVPAVAAFAVDVLTDYVPDNRVHLLVGVAALVGAAFAVPGREWVNAATLAVAAALVLWRVVDVEYRGAEQ